MNTPEETRIYPWQQQQWQRFLAARKADHLPHALLLAGSDGIGKVNFAHQIANSLLCEQVNAEGLACGECKSCKVRKSGAHPDFRIVRLPEGKQQITVNAIRQLTEFMLLSRSFGGYRVVIISPADKMNDNASNSLLKSLEEPPSQTMIILVADHMSRLPATIRSRCQVFAMVKPSPQQSLEWLSQQELQHPAEQLLKLADDKPLLARALDLHEELLANRNRFAKDLIALLRSERSMTQIAKDWEKFDPEVLINWQLKWLIAVMKMLSIRGDEAAENNRFLQQISEFLKNQDDLYRVYTGLTCMKAMTDYPLNRLMFTEAMLLLWRDDGQPQSTL